MLNSELIKRLMGINKDAHRVLIEFPKVGGPYRTPGAIKDGPMNRVDIGAFFPRTDIIVRDFFINLMDHPRDGEVHLSLNQDGNIVYYNIGGIRIGERAIVLIASDTVPS